MLRRLWDSLKRRISGKELVGVDQNGNSYYRWLEKEPHFTGRMIEKREVDFAVSGDYDPTTLSPEWYAWLHRFRKYPPSPEECERIAQEKAERAAKVAAIEAEEQKRKFERESLKAQGMPVDPQPNLKRYLEQLTSLGYGQEESPEEKK